MDTTQLKRIADALEEILRLVKLDQEANEARKKQNDNEQKTRTGTAQDLDPACSLAQGQRLSGAASSKLQAQSSKLQAKSRKLDCSP